MSILPEKNPDPKPFAGECKCVADALRSIRKRLQEMVKDGHWPVGSWGNISTIIVSGYFVAQALNWLADDKPGEPYYFDEPPPPAA